MIRKLQQNGWLLNVSLMGVILIVALMSGMFGQVDLDVAQVAAAVFGPPDSPEAIIVRELRLPRVLLAILAGASLGYSGAALQGLLRNPLADPGVIGVSASASLGAVIAIYMGLAAMSSLAIPVMAMAGAFVSTAILMLLASRDASADADPGWYWDFKLGHCRHCAGDEFYLKPGDGAGNGDVDAGVA